MENLRDFYTILENHIALFDGLTSLEAQKLEAIVENDIDRLDAYMRAEQAYTLELRGLDIKREKIQENLGIAGLTLSAIIERTEGEQKKKLTDLYTNLRDKIEDLDAAITCTKKFIELHLDSIGFLEDKLKKQRAEGAPYEKSGKKRPENPPAKFTSKKV
jgi:hypothetical protein